MAIWGVGVGFRGVFLFYCVSLFEGEVILGCFCFFMLDLGFSVVGRKFFFEKGI